MARRRKKKNRGKRKQKQQEADAPTAADADESPESGGESVEEERSSTGEPTDDGPADGEAITVLDLDDAPAPISIDDEDPVTPISVDDEEPVTEVSVDDDEPITEFSIDDEEIDDRDALIAEAIAFAAAESGETFPEQSPDPSVEPASDDESLETAGPEAAGPEEDRPAEADTPEGDRPRLTADAVAALTQMQADGLVRLPDELVLDLGEATTDEDRDRLLAAALAHVEMQEARYRVPTDRGTRRRWKGTIASAMVTLALIMTVAPPGLLVPDPPPPLEEADRTYGVLVALMLQAQQIDAFRAREQRLPNDLSEVGAELHGIRFVKSNNRVYQLVGHTSDGIAVVYDSAAPADIFRQIAERWVTTQGEG